MPEGETWLWVLFGLVMGVVTIGTVGIVGYMRSENRSYSAESKRWASLAASGETAEGRVTRFALHGNNMTRAGSHGQTVCAATLDIDYTDHAGTAHAVTLQTFIEDALVPSFTGPGRRVFLRYDPQQPASVAIDRARTPLELPRAP